MTCIVAIKDKGKVFIGCDSAGTGGVDLQIRKDPKIYINGPFMIGFTSSFRMGQILGHSLRVQDQKKQQTTQEFMRTTFIDAVRHCLSQGGFMQKSNEVETGGTFIVSYKKKIFVIYDDFQVAEMVENFAAIGCGQDIANGSLFSTKGKAPIERIRLALKAAEAFSAGVRGPFIIKEHY